MWLDGYAAPDPERPLREQLLEARADVRRQLETLQTGAKTPLPGGRLGYPSQVAILTETLERIEAAIASVENDEGRP
jgi:hypothetical protein